MSKYILMIVFLSISIYCRAQYTVEQINAITEQINVIKAIQAEADGRMYDDYIVSFPEDNFNVLFSSGLAYHAVYRKRGTDLLTISENVDFTKIESIKPLKVSTNGIGAFVLEFPRGTINSTLVSDSNVEKQGSNLLYFYYNNYKAKGDRLFNALVDLICKINKANGKNLDGLYLDWKNMVTKNTSAKPVSDFIKKHPQSFLTEYAKIFIAKINAKEAALAAKKTEEERAAKEKRLKAIQNQLAQIDSDLKETRKKSTRNILISSLFGVVGAYAAYYGFTNEIGNQNAAIPLNDVVGVGGGITSLIGFTYLIAGQAILYKPRIKSLKSKKNSLLRERQSLTHIEITPYSNTIMANNYTGLTLRITF